MASLSFPLFARLPTELRLHIWRLSCHPRVVEVEYLPDRDLCRTPTRPPVVLHVCREARHEALRRVYRRAFATRSRDAAIYFGPDLDVLYLPRHGAMGYSETARDFAHYVLDTADLVRSLAIDHVRADIRRPWEKYNKYWLLRSFRHLRVAFLVLDSDPAGRGARGGGGGGGADEIELVDPQDDPAAIMQLMDDVLLSFRHEVGPETVCRNREIDTRGHDGHGVALIPKSKAPPACGCQPALVMQPTGHYLRLDSVPLVDDDPWHARGRLR
ncbi:hypothetical protein VTK73DRAFT_2182 [Phialemonium thermophilum]|uniref:2EXR domain-containing protein n=1 Tax=Phialemonium thermophilum TaxID=223376 RepID=A0ABR3VSF2_9PEZI